MEMDSQDQPQLSLFYQISISTLSSMIAAALVIFAFYPLENIEGKMQLGMLNRESLYSALKKVGFRNSYDGCLASVLGHIFAWGIFIFVTEISKATITTSDDTLLLLFSCNFYSDALGAFFYTTVYTPFSTIKIRLISDSQYKNSIKAFISELIKKRKILELFAGYSISLMFIIEGMIQLSLYESLKSFNSSYFDFFLIGIVSKFFAISLTYPYRMLTSILQSRPMSLYAAIKLSMKSAGVYGLYSGYSACLIRQLPPSGFLFLILEYLRKLLTLALHIIINI